MVKRSDSVKYLGLLIDEKLTWGKHIDELGSKIVQYASIFRKVRDLLPTNRLQSLFNSLIQSRIDYAIEIYGDANNTTFTLPQLNQLYLN